jgi:DNA-binding IclR family transcriptional regulator
LAGNSAEAGRTVISKVVGILTAFTGGERLSLTEVARRADLPMSTTHRLTVELTQRRLLLRGEDGLYQAGLALRSMCGAGGDEVRLEDRATGVLEDLSGTTGCVARLGVLRGVEVRWMEKRPGPAAISRFAPEPAVPACASAMGRVLLAFSPDVADTLFDDGRPKPALGMDMSVEAFRRVLNRVRVRHVATVLTRERERAVAMPVFGAGGSAVAALELAVAPSPERRPGAVLAPLSIAARSLSRDMAVSPAAHLSLRSG